MKLFPSGRVHPLWWVAMVLFFAEVGLLWIAAVPAWVALLVWTVGLVCAVLSVYLGRRAARR